MKNFATFENAKKMLDFVKRGHDLYYNDEHIYVSNYNGYGNFVTYTIDEKDAAECEKYQDWISCLSPDGTIYNDPSYPDFNKNKLSNVEFCEQNYKKLWFVIC